MKLTRNNLNFQQMLHIPCEIERHPVGETRVPKLWYPAVVAAVTLRTTGRKRSTECFMQEKQNRADGWNERTKWKKRRRRSRKKMECQRGRTG